MGFIDHRFTFQSLPRVVVLCAMTGAWGASQAQTIFACTDAKGRRITSDRPIAECMDRDQMELSGAGTVKRVIKPTLTADEREAFEEKQRQEQADLNRRNEERRINKALVTRYPNKTAHDKERADAIKAIDVQKSSAQTRLTALEKDRKKLEDEMLFYQKDPSKAPHNLRKQIQDNQASIDSQNQLIAAQTQETVKLNQRFDQELAKLRELWRQAGRTDSGQPLVVQGQRP